MSEDKRYNGWTNYETWVVKLWLDNEESSYNAWRGIAEDSFREAAPLASRLYEGQTQAQRARCILADELKERHEELLPELTGFAADLLNAAMSEVNWYEIAENMLEDVEEDAEAANG